MTSTRDPHDLLTGTEAAEQEIKCKPDTLPKWRQRGIGPKYIKQGKYIRYRRGDIWEWQASRLTTPCKGEVRS